MSKTKTRPRSKEDAASSSATGTYVYDAALGRMVKVSGRVPGLAKGSADGGFSPESGQAGPCGRTECAGGACMGMGD